jgi:hypothetical protein
MPVDVGKRGDHMQFGILGSLSVTDARGDVAITAGSDRVVRAMLLQNAVGQAGRAAAACAEGDLTPPRQLFTRTGVPERPVPSEG